MAMIKCPHCGTFNPDSLDLCFKCKQALRRDIPVSPSSKDSSESSEPQKTMLWEQKPTQSKRPSIALVFFSLLVVIFLGYVFLIPKSKIIFIRKHDIKCYLNTLLVKGAIDMWEMDHDANKVFPTGILTGSSIITDTRLIPDYLKKLPSCERGGTYQYDNATGTVSCSIHGSIKHPTIPKEELKEYLRRRGMKTDLFDKDY